MRSSERASSRHTSSVSSVEALSEITSSTSPWSWVSTDPTTCTRSWPALRTGKPTETNMAPPLRSSQPGHDGRHRVEAAAEVQVRDAELLAQANQRVDTLVHTAV